MITRDKKKVVIDKYRTHPADTGSAEVQIAILTARIEELHTHFKVYTRDHHSRRGLLKLVGRRRRLLDYLKNRNSESYKDLISRLGIRK